MIACPVCGFRNVSGNIRCLKCRALLEDNPEELRAAFQKADEDTRKEARERLAIPVVLKRYWRKLPVSPLWDLPENVRYRFPLTAGMLSVVPGAGQFYNHQRAKGIFLSLLWWGGALFCLGLIRLPVSNFLLLALLLGWLLVWTDAVASAVRINGETWSFRNSIALWFAALFMTGSVILGFQLLGKGVVSLIRVFDTTQQPDLVSGDLVMVNRTAYWAGSPRLGDVVYFDPDRFTLEQRGQGNIISVNITNYFQRVAALPGDHVEKKDGRFYRNGSPLARSAEPFGGERIPDGWDFRVPQDCFWLPVTAVPETFVGAALGGPSANLFDGGWTLGRWKEASYVPAEGILGRGVAIVDPPARRRWLRE